MLFALLYLVLRRLFGLAEGSKEDQSKDVEILVLRHQLKILRRQAGRPRLRRIDRVFLAAASRALHRPCGVHLLGLHHVTSKFSRRSKDAGPNHNGALSGVGLPHLERCWRGRPVKG